MPRRDAGEAGDGGGPQPRRTSRPPDPQAASALVGGTPVFLGACSAHSRTDDERMLTSSYETTGTWRRTEYSLGAQPMCLRAIESCVGAEVQLSWSAFVLPHPAAAVCGA